MLSVALAAAIWGLCFYWVSRTPLSRTFNVWVGASSNINDELSAKIEKICLDNGMEKCSIVAYDPNDYNYAAAFGIQYSTFDIFILNKNEALAEAEANVFRELPNEYKDENSLEYEYKDGDVTVVKTIGVKFKEDYYVFIGQQSKKDIKLLLKVLDTVAEYGSAA